jgi:hypothetical protein
MSANSEGLIDIPNLKEALKIQKEFLEASVKIRSTEQRGNLAMDHALKGQRKAMNLMTRQFAGGGALGQAMNMLQQVGGMGLQNMQDKSALRDKVKSGTATTEEKSRFSMLSQSKSTGIFEKLDKIFDKSFGGNSRWNKMFAGRGKMAAGGMALGAAGAGIGLASKIIDSSPLMQQMMKLLNFGIMLILRPIGDFFGMLMRPILILLLRKFIIPFYQTVYPWFMNHAKGFDEVVDTITGGNDSINKTIVETGKVAVATTGTGLTAISDILKPKEIAKIPALTENVLNPKNLPVLAKTNPPASNIVKSLEPIIKKSDKMVNIALKTSKAINMVATAPIKIAEKAITKMVIPVAKAALDVNKGVMNLATGGVSGKIDKRMGKVSNKLGGAAKTTLGKATKPAMEILEKAGVKTAVKVAGKTASRFIPIVGQALLAVDAAGSLMKQFAPEQYEGARQGALGIGEMLGDKDHVYTEGVLDFFGFGKKSTAEQLVGGAGWLSDMVTGNKGHEKKGAFGQGGDWFGMATGGIIREPIKGVGKSGQKYKFGERGSEAVIPMDRMRGGDSGVTVNVTVNGSIYSDRDMLNFQRTIMKAIETSSTRKAKL